MPKDTKHSEVSGVNVGSEYTPEEAEFLAAIDRYKKDHNRPHPTWKEVLDVLRSLGWKKTGPVYADQALVVQARHGVEKLAPGFFYKGFTCTRCGHHGSVVIKAKPDCVAEWSWFCLHVMPKVREAHPGCGDEYLIVNL